MRTPNNILMHEFIGLRCRVVGAKNRSQIGISGRIKDETMKTMIIGDEMRSIPKSGSTFRVWLDDATVDIEGDAIMARPEDRIKTKMKRW